jgi:hypothetical protein
LDELPYSDVTPELFTILDLSAFQELWLIEPGDVFVTARPLPRSFVEMVCRLLAVPFESFICLSPNANPDESLLSAIRRTGMFFHLRELAVNRPQMTIRASALDRPIVEMSRDLGVRLEQFAEPPSEPLLDTVDYLNTKSGFREVGQTLGLRVAPGWSHLEAGAAADAVRQLLLRHNEVLVKCDRGSGGRGQLAVNRGALNGRTALAKNLKLFLEKNAEIGHTFVVEARLPLRLDPTIDVEITEDGVRSLYVGAMDCTDGMFHGMTVPAQGLPERPLAELRLASDRLGTYLHRKGYRGFFDIDAGLVANGDLYLFEANVRRTSTSLWDGVLNRVFGGDAKARTVWRLTTRPLRRNCDVSSLFSDRREAFRPNQLTASVVLPTWASSGLRPWIRYLVAGSNWDEVERIDRALEGA